MAKAGLGAEPRSDECSKLNEDTTLAARQASDQPDEWSHLSSNGDAALESDVVLLDFLSKPFCSRYAPILKLVVVTIFSSAGGVIVSPFISTLSERYWGSPKRAGEMTGYISAGSAVLNIFLTPVYGQLLDTIGRRPSFLASAFLSALSTTFLILFPNNFLPFLIITRVLGLIQGSFSSAYIADHVPPAVRPAVFPVLIAVGNGTMLITIVDILGFPPRILFYAACVLQWLAFLLTVFLIQESLPVRLRKHPRDLLIALKTNPFAGVSLLFHKKVARFALAIVTVLIICQVGTGEIVQYYLQERIGMKPAQFAIFMLEVAILSPIVMLGVFPILMKHVSVTFVLVISLLAVIGEQISLATAWSAWPLYAFGVPLDVVSMMALPVVQAIICNAGDASMQGQINTVFSSITDLTSAFGDIMFGAAYGNLPVSLSWIAFVISSGLCVFALFLTRGMMSASADEDAAEFQQGSRQLPESPPGPAVVEVPST